MARGGVDEVQMKARVRKRMILLGPGAVAAVVAALLLTPLGRYAGWAWSRVAGGATVAERVEQYGPAARRRWGPHFERAGVGYPPAEVVLVGIKDRKVLEVWARDAEADGFALVRTCPILAASGHPGPKLREGDRQVPEGLYEIESLHPNSMFHLALRVNYPNRFDRRMAGRDGRSDLGGDIMIHGSDASVGCLAMGDETAEDLFILVADTGLERTRLILTPVDFRESDLPSDLPVPPAWADELYADIRIALGRIRPRE